MEERNTGLFSAFKKVPKYSGEEIIKTDIEKIHKAISSMYGGFNGFPQRKIEDVSLGMMRKLTFKDSAWQMFWLISPLAPNTCKVTLTVDGTGNSEDFFVKLMKELKGKLKL